MQSVQRALWEGGSVPHCGGRHFARSPHTLPHCNLHTLSTLLKLYTLLALPTLPHCILCTSYTFCKEHTGQNCKQTTGNVAPAQHTDQRSSTLTLTGHCKQHTGRCHPISKAAHCQRLDCSTLANVAAHCSRERHKLAADCSKLAPQQHSSTVAAVARIGGCSPRFSPLHTNIKYRKVSL